MQLAFNNNDLAIHPFKFVYVEETLSYLVKRALLSAHVRRVPSPSFLFLFPWNSNYGRAPRTDAPSIKSPSLNPWD